MSRAASSRWPGLAWAGDSPGTRGARAGAKDLMRRAWRVPSRRYRMMEGFHLAALPWHSRWTAIKAKNIRLNVRGGFHPQILTDRQIHLLVNFVCSQARRAPRAGLGTWPVAKADAGTPRQGPVPRRREVTPRGKATQSHRPRRRAPVPPPSSPFPKQFPNQTFLSGVY